MWTYIPNLLTLGRLGLAVVFLLMLLYSPYVPRQALFLDMAFLVFLVAGISDVADGLVARRLVATTRFGRMVDPLVDKVLVCGAFICFAIIGQPDLFGLPGPVQFLLRWLVAGILVVREGYVTVIRHTAEAKGINFAATLAGKIKMFTQVLAIGTVLIKAAHVPTARWGSWFTTIVYVVMVAVTVISGLMAARRVKAVSPEGSTPKAPPTDAGTKPA
ncbi:MAG: CDP-alcohol phosphatidyltransferase family protein [Sedimentisphaerales bacterium]|jgi:CDP-diacylglycerol--glycerol-3-phosphate 3-phosphatidyltransferase|nr:CDP-alcohol phosphatidyltransferase family protein [Sedimentisphaerales bacterium]